MDDVSNFQFFTTLLWQKLRYFLASVLAFTTDITTLFLLGMLSPLPQFASVTLAFLIGAIANYLLCLNWVFPAAKGFSGVPEFIYFLASALFGLSITLMLIHFLVQTQSMPLMASKFFAAGCTLCLTFIIRRFFIFGPLTKHYKV